MYELDLDILKLYPFTKNKGTRPRLSKVLRARSAKTRREADRQTGVHDSVKVYGVCSQIIMVEIRSLLGVSVVKS